jgi:6-phosphogluconolactonase
MKEKKFLSIQEAGSFLKQQLETDLKKQIALRDHALLILPGGNSIRFFFPYLISIDVQWKKITIGLSDERCVPLNNEMSNEKHLRECFLNLLPDYNYCNLNQNLIAKIQEFPPVTLLSMGKDGHVASLFPEERDEWINADIGIYKTVKQSPRRVSLSEKTILLSDSIHVLVVGREKIITWKKLKNNIVPASLIFNNSTIIISV